MSMQATAATVLDGSLHDYLLQPIDPAELAVKLAADLAGAGVLTPDWIPVGERLPTARVEVLIYRKARPESGMSHCFYEMGEYYPGPRYNKPTDSNWRNYDRDWLADELVTHWLPIPTEPIPPTSAD